MPIAAAMPDGAMPTAAAMTNAATVSAAAVAMPVATTPVAMPSFASTMRDEDFEMSEATDEQEEMSDTESEMDREDEKEALMLAEATEHYLGNAEEQPVMPDGEFTNQDLLESMYNRRDKLVKRMVSAMRFHARAGKEVQEANIKSYDEAQKKLEELEANIERCEKAFRCDEARLDPPQQAGK